MDDAVLLGRSLSGDADAFRGLYDRHAASVYGYALRLLGDGTRAEDVTQEVFLALMRRGRSYDPSRPFRTWLLTMARNASIDQIRRRRARPESALGDEARGAAAPLPPEPGLAEFVEQALATLPEAYRETIWLCDALGMSYREAGDLLGCDTGTVGSRVSRARQMLREHLMRNGHAL